MKNNNVMQKVFFFQAHYITCKDTQLDIGKYIN